MRVLDRYIGREMAAPLVFGVAAFSSLFIGTDLINLARLAIDTGVPAMVVFRLLLMRMPQIVVYTLPMSVLMAALLSLSRLSASSEIVAMRAGGVSFYRLIMPVLAIGVLVSLLTMGVNELVVPAANATYARIMREEITHESLPEVTKNVILKEYQDGRLSRFLYAADFDKDTRTMHDVSMLEFAGGRPVRQTNAARLVWEENAWYFVDGVVYSFRGEQQESSAGAVSLLRFTGARQRLNIPQKPADIPQQEKRPEDMTISELRQQIALLGRGDHDLRQYQLQLHLKIAVPLASLVFAFVGAPLGIQSHRSATSIGFGLSVIIIFIYYIMLTFGSALGQSGQLPPALAAWLQNIILGVAGLILIWRARK